MIEKKEKWWQRPQPAWVNFVVSVLGMVAVLVAWNITQFTFASSTVVNAVSANTIHYEGFLEDSVGNPLDGLYDLQFAIYDASAGGSLLWGPESYTDLPIDTGVFAVDLGSSTSGGLPAAVWSGANYLQITIEGETLSPRELIRSLPIPDGSVTSDKLAPLMERVDAPAEVQLTETPQTIVSTDIFVEKPSRALVIVTCDCQTNDGALILGTLWANGVQVGNDTQLIAGAYPTGNTTAGFRNTVSNTYVVDLSAGNNQIEFQASKRDSNGTAKVYDIHTGISYLVVGQ